jgi:hypothetical protein
MTAPGVSVVTQQRLALAVAGFTPLPVKDKGPRIDQWQQRFFGANAEQIMTWEPRWPDHPRTGILTKFTPAADIDIMHPEAAAAVEALAREHFEERGRFLVRFGRAPKRAILLRTDVPFAKILRKFVDPAAAPDSKPPQIEILAAGQQVVAFGIHVETGKPYSWHGGEPGAVNRDDLPCVSEADMHAFVDAAAKLLVGGFGFKDSGGGGGGKRKPPGHWHRVLTNPIQDGERNTTLASVAGKLLHDGVKDLSLLFDMMLCVNIARCQPPLPANTIEAIVKSVTRTHIAGLNRR